MGIKNKIYKGHLYLLTLTVVDWVDVFTRPSHKHIIVESLKFCQKNKGLELYAWCLMSNHLHLIASTSMDHHLSGVLRDMKQFTAKRILKEIETENESRKDWMLYRFEYAAKYKTNHEQYQFWQSGNEPKEITSPQFLKQKLDYIHDNPVKAEIVDEPHHYLYSSARNYADMGGLIDVILAY